jgi:hypothetical protein
MALKLVTYTLPAYWASYLINGDASGLDDGEQQQIDRWMRNNRPGYPLDCGEESWFAHSNDATNLGDDVMEFTFEAFPEDLDAIDRRFLDAHLSERGQ